MENKILEAGEWAMNCLGYDHINRTQTLDNLRILYNIETPKRMIEIIVTTFSETFGYEVSEPIVIEAIEDMTNVIFDSYTKNSYDIFKKYYF